MRKLGVNRTVHARLFVTSYFSNTSIYTNGDVTFGCQELRLKYLYSDIYAFSASNVQNTGFVHVVFFCDICTHLEASQQY